MIARSLRIAYIAPPLPLPSYGGTRARQTGVITPHLAIPLLGRLASAPLLIAPCAMHQLAHPDAELATVRGRGRLARWET